ncbi:MAG: universal stress protein [Kofleriaceae bacterium]
MVGIDPADDPTRLLGVAWARAQRDGAGLVVCEILADDDPRSIDEQEHVLARQIKELCPEAGEVRTCLRRGEPAEQLLACSESYGATLLVVSEASRREGWFARTFRPGVTTSVVRGAACPVLIARHNYGTGRIIVATDLADPELPALAAAALRDRAPSTVTVVHCVPAMPMTAIHAGMADNAMASAHADLIVDARARLVEAAVTAGLLGASCRIEVGPPGEVIVSLATELSADLVIVGNHPRSSADRALGGSVCEHVVREAPGHVLVVRLADAA